MISACLFAGRRFGYDHSSYELREIQEKLKAYRGNSEKSNRVAAGCLGSYALTIGTGVVSNPGSWVAAAVGATALSAGTLGICALGLVDWDIRILDEEIREKERQEFNRACPCCVIL